MKQLTCEMCGSTDIVKDGGVFVCQTCGCKYSVAEAKKMMTETIEEDDHAEDYLGIADTSQDMDSQDDMAFLNGKNIEIETITCPQCGSSDVSMSTETQGICNVCGAQFVVQPGFENQNIYNETTIYYGQEDKSNISETAYYEIIPEYSEKDFLRASWISLAKEDAPLDIFECDFTDIEINDHQIFLEEISADTSYVADIGNDREEPYIDYETYEDYELHDKIEYYTEGFGDQKKEKQRIVQEKIPVKKQRQVTRYRTVTDWTPTSGTLNASSSVMIENIDGLPLDESRYLQSKKGASDNSIIALSEDLKKQIEISESTRKSVDSEHNSNLTEEVYYYLSGDHKRNLNVQIKKITSSSSTLTVAKEYSANMKYNNTTYKKYAFPFGKIMSVGGDTIRNSQSLESVKQEKNNELKRWIGEKTDELNAYKQNEIEDVGKRVWNKTKVISILTFALLVGSIVVSVFVHYLAIVIGLFAVAAAAFVFNTIVERRETKAEREVCKERISKAASQSETEINNEKKKVADEISNYSANYKIKQTELLNNKLVSLGLEPVGSDVL